MVNEAATKSTLSQHNACASLTVANNDARQERSHGNVYTAILERTTRVNEHKIKRTRFSSGSGGRYVMWRQRDVERFVAAAASTFELVLLWYE